MKKWLLLFAALITLPLWGTPDTNSYQVVSGDNLWNISKAYLSNPFRWKDLWEWNPQIKNPHLIYPGDLVRIYPDGKIPESNHSDFKQNIPFEQKVAGLSTVKTPDAQNDFVNHNDSDVSGKLKEEFIMRAPMVLPTSAKGEALTASVGDWLDMDKSLSLFESYPVQKNRESEGFLEVLTQGPKIKSYKAKIPLGRVVEIAGLLELRFIPSSQTVNTKENKRPVARLIQQYNPIRRDEKVRPYDPRVIETIKGYEKVESSNAVGQIIYTSSSARSVLPYTYVICDYLEGDNHLKQGDGVIFLNRNPVTNKPTDQILGRGLVVLEQASTSSILVTEVYPGVLGLGDFVRPTHKAVRF